jgi:hypothetical protein
MHASPSQGSVEGEVEMRRNLTLAVWLLATMALALIGATAAAANPHTTYTCTKTKNNGQTDVKTSVPEPSLGGLTNAGYTCVAEAPPAEDEVQEEDEVQDDEVQDDEVQEEDEVQDDEVQEEDEVQDETESETRVEGQGDDSMPEENPEPKAGVSSSLPVTLEAPSESRSLYCSTHGPVERGNGEGPGVALNLTVSQGALLVEKGDVTPGVYYAGIGVSCDLLPGFTYSEFWVNNVGDAAPGVAVYPYYVPTTS